MLPEQILAVVVSVRGAYDRVDVLLGRRSGILGDLVDVLECNRCGGQMKILAAIHSTDIAVKSLTVSPSLPVHRHKLQRFPNRFSSTQEMPAMERSVMHSASWLLLKMRACNKSIT